MRVSFKQLAGSALVIMALAISALTLSACSSGSTAASSTQIPATTSATAAASVTSTTQAPPLTSNLPVTPEESSTAPASNFQQPQGTTGTLNSINANILILTDRQGSQVTINISDTTTVQKTVSGTITDVQPGDFLTVVGSPDAGGNVTATAISIRPAGQGFPTPSPGASFAPGASFTPRGTPSRTGTGNPSGFPNGGTGRGTVGTAAGVSGNSITLATTQGNQITVTVSDTTTIQKTATGAIADLQPGQSLVVTGAPDTNGIIIARSISIQSADQGFQPSSPASGN